MAFHLAQRMSAVMLMVSACPESGFLGRPAARPRPRYSARVGRGRFSARPAQPRPTYRTMCANQSRQSQQPHELRYRPEAAPVQAEK